MVKASCPEDCAVDCLWQSDVFACRVSGFICLGVVCFLGGRGGLWIDEFGLVLNNCFR